MKIFVFCVLQLYLLIPNTCVCSAIAILIKEKIPKTIVINIMFKTTTTTTNYNNT